MTVWISILIVLLAFAGMEAFSWAFHKYIMHGPLWFIHQTHHRKSNGIFEMNDIFSAFFAGISMLFIISGLPECTWQFWVGLGIALYGLTYFVLHDMLIHRRVQTRLKAGGRYIRGIAKAHQAHHQKNNKEEGVSFGLLLASKRFFKD